MCGGWGSLYSTCPPGEWKHVPYIQNIVYLVLCWSVCFTLYVCMHVFSVVSKCTFCQHVTLSLTSISSFAWCLLLSVCRPVCHVHSAVYLCVSALNTSLREPAILSLSPLFFFCHTFVLIFFFFFFFFFSASATCVVAMFLCLYISEHLLFQQGPHGLKCQSKQLPDKCIVQQACVSPPPIPPLLVLWC